MKDPTPETPLTADDLGKVASDGLDGIVAGNKARNAELAAANAAFLAKQAAERPRWKTPRFWLGILSTVAGIALSIAAGAGADPADIDLARQVATGVQGAAENVVAADEAGDWTQGLGGAALAAGGLVAAFGEAAPKAVSPEMQGAIAGIVIGTVLGAWAVSLVWQRKVASLEADLVALALKESRLRRGRGDL